VLAAASHIKLVPDPPEELESLFREHYSLVFRTAYRITGSIADAEDVLQTVFLRLARRAKDLELSPSPGSYLRRAAVNASLDLVRSRGRSDSTPLEEVKPDLIHSHGRDPEAQQLERELRKLIRQAIASLSTRTAEIVVLRYFEGYDNYEIAQLLGTSQVLVAVVLHRARNQLRKEISKFLEGRHEC
jgi:RNA polymerase sigma-70 factor (ECF subfamily)